jgi:hypothetical protein
MDDDEDFGNQSIFPTVQGISASPFPRPDMPLQKSILGGSNSEICHTWLVNSHEKDGEVIAS